MAGWLTRLPVRARLTAWYVFLLAAILATLGSFLLLRLRADLVARYVTRLLAYMDARGYAVATPRPPQAMPTRPLLDLSSGYIRRSLAALPGQGTRTPWVLRQNYLRDVLTLRRARLADGALRFARAGSASRQPSAV